MTISKLIPSKHVEGRWLAFLEDGTVLRLTEREVADFALYAGMELDEETWGALSRSAGESAARSKALDLVSNRPYGKGELEKRLRQGKFSPEAAGQTAQWMEDIGLVNDAEYARTVAKHYAAKGYGPQKIKFELQNRKVPREFWDDALAELDDPAGAIDAILRKKLAGKEADKKELKKAADALARRGYHWSDISAALGRYGAEDLD